MSHPRFHVPGQAVVHALGTSQREHDAGAVSNALPQPLTSLIGRETEVAAALALLAERGVRLLTLTGPGGVGKTRLALRVGEEAAALFPDRVRFIPLAAITDSALVLPVIAWGLGLREAGAASIRELVTGFLQRKRMLLVLDNFEQVRPAAVELAALLASCPDITVMVTSRVLLRVAGEQLLVIGPLPLPAGTVRDRDHDAVLAGAAASPAVQLFTDRAQAIEHGFTLTEDNVGPIERICRKLDGLPLAIELAAARLRALSPAELEQRLDPSLLFLTGGPVDAPDRLRTMRDAIAWSHDLLRPDEQVVFRRLTVFIGGFTVEAAAEVVAAATADDSHALFDRLVALVDASLLHRSEAGGATRFSMLETIREFGWEKLLECGEQTDIELRHAAWYLVFATRIRREGGLSQQRGLALLEAEQPNFRAALTRFLAHGEPARALRLAGRLAEFWMRHGHLTEGRSWLEQALAATGGAPSAARAEALVGLNMLLWSAGDLDRSHTLLGEAEFIAREVGDDAALAYVRLHQGYVAAFRGDQNLAVARGEEALTTYPAIPQRFSQHGALWLLARMAMEREDVERTENLYQRLLTSARAGGDEVSLINALYDLATLAARRGAFAEALAGYTEAAGVCLAIDDRFHASYCLNRVAVCAVALGQPEAATRVFAAAHRLRTDIGATATAFVKELESHERALADARAALGDDRYGVLWDEGLVLSAQAVIAGIGQLDHAITSPASNHPRAVHPLTPREREVLELVVAGRADKEIAAELAIGRRTVSNHISVILAKLGVTSRTAAAVAAVRDGLI